jgi:dTMP kinase
MKHDASTSGGFLITFEGPEGGGKSTQIRLLAKTLREQGHSVIVTREPGGTETAERIREVLLHSNGLSDRCELLLMLAGRADHVEEQIRPALAEGKIVLCDRFVDSSAAYQGGGRGLNRSLIRTLNTFVCDNIWPDMTFLLDLDPRLGLERVGQGVLEFDRIEQAGLAFHRRVRECFLELSEGEPDRFVRVAASRPIEEIQATIQQAVEDLLRGKTFLSPS